MLGQRFSAGAGQGDGLSCVPEQQVLEENQEKKWKVPIDKSEIGVTIGGTMRNDSQLLLLGLLLTKPLGRRLGGLDV